MADSVPHFHTVSEPDKLQQIKSKYKLILNLIPAMCSKKVARGQQKPGKKLCNAQKIPVWNIPKVNRLNGSMCL